MKPRLSERTIETAAQQPIKAQKPFLIVSMCFSGRTWTLIHFQPYDITGPLAICRLSPIAIKSMTRWSAKFSSRSDTNEPQPWLYWWWHHCGCIGVIQTDSHTPFSVFYSGDWHGSSCSRYRHLQQQTHRLDTEPLAAMPTLSLPFRAAVDEAAAAAGSMFWEAMSAGYCWGDRQVLTDTDRDRDISGWRHRLPDRKV